MDTGAPGTPRWVQRFENFDRALVLLREAMELLFDQDRQIEPEIRAIMREGAIQRFEYTFELAWKTLKDYLQWRKAAPTKQGPGDIIRAAFASGYIEDGEAWMEALDARNEMSHVYRQQAFERVIGEVRVRFVPCFESLHEMLLDERIDLERG